MLHDDNNTVRVGGAKESVGVEGPKWVHWAGEITSIVIEYTLQALRCFCLVLLVSFGLSVRSDKWLSGSFNVKICYSRLVDVCN